MAGNRSRDTRPELALRRILHARGLRYRNDEAPVRRFRMRADIVFRRHRVAVFVDGCFWHSCPDHRTLPKAHREYWLAKLERTVSRDREQNAALAVAGWHVVRVWEHENAHEAADRVVAALRLAEE